MGSRSTAPTPPVKREPRSGLVDLLMRGVVTLLAGAFCGVLWWAVSWALGAQAYGLWGRSAATGLLAAVVTGITITAISTPLYRRVSARALYWYSPLSVYTAIAIYGLAIFVLRHFIDDFHTNQIRWAVGLQSVLGMWWGVTMLLPLTVAVQVLAYVNHRVLRRILTTT
jgi:hypothetical protein